MKSGIAWLIITFCSLIVCTGIAFSAEQTSNIFNPALLPAKATYKYKWSLTLIPIGETTFTIAKTKEGNFLIKCTGLENTSVVVSGKDLKPISATRFMNYKSKTYKVSSTFTNKEIKVNAVLPTGPQTAIVPIQPDLFHNDALLITLMAMNMAPGKSISFKHYNPSNSNITPCKITVEKEEKIKVPAGSFNTYKLKLDIGNGLSVHRAWYDKNIPHKLVQYYNADAKTTAKLVK